VCNLAPGLVVHGMMCRTLTDCWRKPSINDTLPESTRSQTGSYYTHTGSSLAYRSFSIITQASIAGESIVETVPYFQLLVENIRGPLRKGRSCRFVGISWIVMCLDKYLHIFPYGAIALILTCRMPITAEGAFNSIASC
jgi:hypothetical protein